MLRTSLLLTLGLLACAPPEEGREVETYIAAAADLQEFNRELQELIEDAGVTPSDASKLHSARQITGRYLRALNRVREPSDSLLVQIHQLYSTALQSTSRSLEELDAADSTLLVDHLKGLRAQVSDRVFPALEVLAAYRGVDGEGTRLSWPP